ncbi:MAG TPA: hypothetical protein VN616_00360 [Puia sp.]|nr:hypothetical protein [Puia sp.]
MQVYTGNLSEMTTASQLAIFFLPFGSLHLSHIGHGKMTGRSLASKQRSHEYQDFQYQPEYFAG